MRPFVLLSVICILTSPAWGRIEPGSGEAEVLTPGRAAGSEASDAERQTIDANAFVVDTKPMYLEAFGPQLRSAACSDGTDFFVVWEDGRNGIDWDAYGVQVSKTGTVYGSASACLAADSGDQLRPAVASDGLYDLVVWSDVRGGDNSIRAARTSRSGEVIACITVSDASGYRGHPALAFDGVNYLVAWEDERNGPPADIYGARISQNGQVLDSSGIALSCAAGRQAAPALVYDGVQFLVVWEDERNGQLSCDIFGTRVASSGTVLDTAGIAISTAANWQRSVAASSNGTGSLVVWDDFRNGQHDIFGARVSQAGEVLDPSGIGLSTAPYSQAEPAIAFDGSNFLAAWRDERSGASEISGTRVSPGGTVLDSAGLEICDHTGHQGEPSVAAVPGFWLVAWSDERNVHSDIFASRVWRDGSVLDPEGILLSGAANEQRIPSVAFDGTQFLVTWQDGRVDPYNLGVYGLRVTPDGVVRDSAVIDIAATGNWERQPSVGWDGASFYVSWSAIDTQLYTVHIYGAQVAPDGQVGSYTTVCGVEGSQEYPVVAGGPTSLVVWQDSRAGPSDVYGTRVSRAGNVMDPDGIPVSVAAGSQYFPAAALGRDSFIVVWQDDRDGASDIYAARVTPEGVVLDPDGIAVSAAPDTQSRPAVAFDGSIYFVVWEDGRDGGTEIYGARLTPAGEVVDPDGIAIASGGGTRKSPDVVFDGVSFLVVWQDLRGDAGDIYSARVTADGIVLDTMLVAGQAGEQAEPALAGDSASGLLLVYRGWTGSFGGGTYNTCRTWGKTSPFIRIREENPRPEAQRSRQAATIVRGVLFLPSSLLSPRSSLISADGRVVLDLKPGANDVSHLTSGVYFVREASGVEREASAIAKVIVSR